MRGKRFVSVMLAALICLSSIGTVVWAEETTAPEPYIEEDGPVPIKDAGPTLFSADEEANDLTVPEEIGIDTNGDDPGPVMSREAIGIGDSNDGLTNSALQAPGDPQGAAASGSCGQSLTWVLTDDGVMTISGTGAMTNYSEGYKIPWYSYTGVIRKVIVEEGVTTLSQYAFRGCGNLAEISLPNTLTVIGAYAFANCPNLLAVTFPVTLVSIGQEAFSGCSSLTEIALPCPAGRWAFTNCISLETVMILDGSAFIGEGAFSDCTSLTRVSIPSSVTEIRKSAFGGCSRLRMIDIPESVTVFGWGVFAGSGITSMILPEGVTAIDGWLFSNCQDLRCVVVLATVTKINERAFDKCSNLTDVYFTGTAEQWKSIEVLDTWDGNPPSYYGYDESFNQPLYNAKIHYGSAGPEPFTRIIYSSGPDGERRFTFNQNEEVEDLVLSTASTEYNPRLAHMLCVMARAAYDQALVRSDLEEMGFFIEDELFCGTDYYEDYSDGTTAAFSLAKKTISDGSTFVMITIRGTSDWSATGDGITNAQIGIAALNGLGKHEGFQIDAETIYDALNGFLGGIPASDITYVITGHSQGAAAGNLLAVMLYDNGVPSSRVYDYNFACPNVACILNPNDWNPGGAHDNIFNLGNVEDPVTYLPSNLVKAFIPRLSPLSTWGKFGRSYWFFPNESNHSAAGHDMIYYDNALSYEYPLSAFAEYPQISQEYIRRVVGVHCPVDVIVYDADGSPLAGVIDNEANYYDSAFGEVMIFVDGDEKWIYLLGDQNYDVRLTATDEGEMRYEVYDIDFVSEALLDEKTFGSVSLTDGREMISYVDERMAIPDVALYVVGDTGGAAASVQEDGSETAIPQGDVNGSGGVDAADLARLLQYVSGRRTRLIASGDVNGDETVDTADLLHLLKYLVGCDVPLR